MATPPRSPASVDLPDGYSRMDIPHAGLSSVDLRLQQIQADLQDAMRQQDRHRIQQLVAERSKIASRHEHLVHLHPDELQENGLAAPVVSNHAAVDSALESSCETADSSDTDDGEASVAPMVGETARRFSRNFVGLETIRQSSIIPDARQSARSLNALADAHAVANNRNDVLFNSFSRHIVCFAIGAIVLTVLLFAIFIWHIAAYIYYYDVACDGTLPILSKVILAASIVCLFASMRVFGIANDRESVEYDEAPGRLPTIFRSKDCCALILIQAMAVNVVGLYWLNNKAHVQRGAPSCREVKLGLYVATVAHAVVLVVYALYLVFAFYGVAKMLRRLMTWGVLRTKGAAPDGALECNTVEVPQIDEEDLECPICLENMTPDTALMTKDCHHVFHRTCLKHWMQVHAACPVCRHDLGAVL